MTAETTRAPEPADARDTRRPKLIRGLGLKARLAATCVAFLSIGALLAPRERRETAPSEEKTAPILQAEAQRREPARVFRALQETGQGAAAFSVALRAPAAARAPSFADFEQPPGELRARSRGFGIVVTPDSVLTHIDALGGKSDPPLRFADGGVGESSVAGYEAETGLVLLRVRGRGNLKAAVEASGPAVPGELAVAAARSDGGDFVAPVFVASEGPDRHSITLSTALLVPGTPVFNLAGEALAIAAGSRASAVAYPVADAMARLGRLAEAGRRLPSSIGVFLQPNTPALAKIFGEGGALVSDVAPASPAARADLLAGDVILRVAGAEVASVPDALAKIAALPGAVLSPLTVRRKGRESTKEVVPLVLLASLPSSRPPAPPPEAPLAREVFPAESLAALGLPDDVVVLAVHEAPVDARALSAALRRAKLPVLLRLQHESRRFFAAIEKAP